MKKNKMWELEKYPPNPKNWNRQKCDTPNSWIVFQKYLQLDAPRYLKNIPGVSIGKTGQVSSNIQRWCAKKAWASRAQERDFFLLKEKAKRLERKREALIEQQEEADLRSRTALLEHVEELSYTLVGYATGRIWTPPTYHEESGILLIKGKYRKLKATEKIDPWRYKAILSIMAICGVSAKTEISIDVNGISGERPDVSKFEGMSIQELTRRIFEERK